MMESTLTLRQRAQAIFRRAGWDLPLPPIRWAPRLSSTAGRFSLRRSPLGKWQAEIVLSIPLLRRPDRPWPVMACGLWCHDPEELVDRILEHELIHYALWSQNRDWGHTAEFKRLAGLHFGHQGIRHDIQARVYQSPKKESSSRMRKDGSGRAPEYVTSTLMLHVSL